MSHSTQKEQGNIPAVGQYTPSYPRAFIDDGVSFPRELARQEVCDSIFHSPPNFVGPI